MFDFLGMAADYESRKVDRFEKGDLFVSTARVTDATQPFETAVAHPDYNDGEIVIVERYDTKEQAQAGHKRWVKVMTADKLPKELEDVSSAEVAKMLDAGTGTGWRKMPRQKRKGRA